MDGSPGPAVAPPDIVDLARLRAEARTRHEWGLADALRARIEAAGWRVTDHGARSSLSPATPATIEMNGEARYGSAAAVPSLLHLPATAAWSVVTVASEEPHRMSAFLAGLRVHASAPTRVVIVANDPSETQAKALAQGAPDLEPVTGLEPEVIRTSVRLGLAAALNIGLQRAAGELVLLADATAVPTGDALTPVAAALADPTVAAAGAPGLILDPDRPQLNRLRLSEGTGARPVVALELQWLACRRSDCRLLGPLDEHFITPAWLGPWWTLHLRAGSEAPAAGSDDVERVAAGRVGSEMPGQAEARTRHLRATRTAVTMDLPLAGIGTTWPPERTRMNRRNMYRLIDDFGGREGLT